MCYQAFNCFHLVIITVEPTLIRQFNVTKYSKSKKQKNRAKNFKFSLFSSTKQNLIEFNEMKSPRMQT